jgi:dTDP-4-dehydrorhamnose reductase
LESDPVSPACVYGRSKAEAERLVLDACEQALIVRTSAFFGPWDRYNFAWHVLTALARGDRVDASDRAIVSPTFVPDLCHATLDLLIDGETGIRHLANQGSLSWHAFARRIAEGAGFDPDMIDSVDGPAANTALASEHGTMLRPLDASVGAYLREIGNALDAPFSIAAE